MWRFSVFGSFMKGAETDHNIARLMEGKTPDAQGSWNAVCLSDFDDGGIAFVAQPQIPPRNVNWSSSGKWVHAAKVGFEKYFLHKVKLVKSEPLYEKLALQALGIEKLSRSLWTTPELKGPAGSGGVFQFGKFAAAFDQGVERHVKGG